MTVGIGGVRVGNVLAGTAPVNGRTSRTSIPAHLNCAEHLPLFAAVVLTGALVHADSARMDTLAVTYLGARVLQSLVHIAGPQTTSGARTASRGHLNRPS